MLFRSISGSLYSKKTPAYIFDILSDASIRAYGIFNPEKVKTLLAKIERQETSSEIDQMALVGILSTQLLYKMFIQEPIIADVSVLKNYKFIDASEVLI